MIQDNSPVHSAFSEQQMRTLLELISDGIWDWDANTGYVYRNPGWYAMLGYPNNFFANTVKTWEDIIYPEDYQRVMAHFEASIHQQQPYRIEYRCQCQDGTYLWIEDRAHIIVRNEDGSVARMLGAQRNIDASKRLVLTLQRENHSLEAMVYERTRELSLVNQQLQQHVDENRRLAEHDALTQTVNRYGLDKTLLHQCARARRFRHPLALIVMDIDNFKQLNDRHGHLFGDTVLVNLVAQIQSALRPHDVLARWGGDEFVVVLPQTALNEALLIAGNIHKAIAMLSPINGNPLTISSGVVTLMNDEEQRDFLDRGDRALYRAKEAGKNIIKE